MKREVFKICDDDFSFTYTITGVSAEMDRTGPIYRLYMDIYVCFVEEIYGGRMPRS